MKLLILTSSRRGTASYFLPILLGHEEFQVVRVVYNRNELVNKKHFLNKKLRKILKIGILGALNGIRIRRWFNEDVDEFAHREDIFELCKISGIEINETIALSSSETVDIFKRSGAELGLSLGNGYIPSKVFSSLKYGMVNVHGEQLPEYQNAQSIIWQIYNESRNTGYTIHEINKGIDTGRILYQEIFPIQFQETLGKTVAYNCAQILRRSALGMVELLKNFQDYKAKAVDQGTGKSYTTPTFSQFLRIQRNFKKLSLIAQEKEV